jgi:hypothetical protein
LFSDQSSWLQIQRSRVRFLEVPHFLKVMGVGRGPFSFVRISEELLERKVAVPAYKTEISGSGDQLC